jgi:ketosteroid isomerase-like protein
MAVIENLRDAQNRHDLDAFVACFAPDYRSEQPAHPARAFTGRDQVRANWAEVFRGVRDFRAELQASAANGDIGWAEWRWTGTHADGAPFHWRGVTLFGVQGGRIAWGRLYMEPVEEAGAGIEQTVRDMAQGARRPRRRGAGVAPAGWPPSGSPCCTQSTAERAPPWPCRSRPRCAPTIGPHDGPAPPPIQAPRTGGVGDGGL